MCDPPYGIRAGARMEGSNRANRTPIPDHKRDTHIPQTQPYGATQLMTELLDNAARLLNMGGRLVYLLPCTSDFILAELPVHPCLRLVANSEERLTIHLSRRLITMEKCETYDTTKTRCVLCGVWCLVCVCVCVQCTLCTRVVLNVQ